MPTGQNYATNVPQTTLSAGIAAGTTSFGVASLSSWPATPFTAVLEIGTSLQEPIDVLTVSGNTITSCTRAIDGTTAFAHATGATLTHADIGRDFREARAHIDATGGNDSTGKAVHGTGSAVVGKDDTQTLTNKSLTSPTITGTVAGGATYTGIVLNTTTPSSPPSGKVALYAGGTGSGIGLKFPSGATSTVPSIAASQMNGFVTWAYDPVVTAAGGSISPNGTIVFSKILVPFPVTITTVVMYVTTGGTSLTSGQCFAGIYDSSGTRVAVTADQSTPWGSSGAKSMSVGSTSLDVGTYYVAVVANSTGSLPQFAMSNSTITNVTNINLSAPFRASFSGSGNTSLPASVTLGSMTAMSYQLFAGLL